MQILYGERKRGNYMLFCSLTRRGVYTWNMLSIMFATRTSRVNRHDLNLSQRPAETPIMHAVKPVRHTTTRKALLSTVYVQYKKCDSCWVYFITYRFDPQFPVEFTLSCLFLFPHYWWSGSLAVTHSFWRLTPLASLSLFIATDSFLFVITTQFMPLWITESIDWLTKGATQIARWGEPVMVPVNAPPCIKNCNTSSKWLWISDRTLRIAPSILWGIDGIIIAFVFTKKWKGSIMPWLSAVLWADYGAVFRFLFLFLFWSFANR